MLQHVMLNTVTTGLLRLMALQFTWRPSLNRYLKSVDDWINFSVGIATQTGSVEQSIIFQEGKVSVRNNISDEVDVLFKFRDEKVLQGMLFLTPNELLTYVMKNELIIEGNLTLLQLFNFYISLLLGKTHHRMLTKKHPKILDSYKDSSETKNSTTPGNKRVSGRLHGLIGTSDDSGVLYITNPYLSHFSLSDFPRLQTFRKIHFHQKPEICEERPKLLTEWYRSHGFEKDMNGQSWEPELRQAFALKHLMENKKPIIRENDLLAGTTTAKEVGVIIYPDAQGTLIWGELNSISQRILNPYDISNKVREVLHHEVFPYWIHRNFRERVRSDYDYPLCQRLDERFVPYFVWKTVGISHTVPDIPRLLTKGTSGIIKEIEDQMVNNGDLSDQNNVSLRAMKLSLEGVNTYAQNLSDEARRLSEKATSTQRKKELDNLAVICAHVPEKPARSLDEAMNAIWIVWVALHMENTNTGLSLGRLDQCLQTYFENDVASLSSDDEREQYIKHAVELVGCFFLRCTDHLPLSPDIGNYLFSGSSSDQAITLGGVTSTGKDAVNDMTYIFLKVTEMLAIRDPNINARYNRSKNSTTYLNRLCEVNLITAATPSMHNDDAVFNSLKQHQYPMKDIRDWSATGCVEPTLSGKHMGHTGSILFNLVAPLEMALNNGRHPLMNWSVGPRTGNVENGSFQTFDHFLEAYWKQLEFLIHQAGTLNMHLAETHASLRPTPLLSSLIQGSIAKGRDVTRGGALYNTSGTANIGLVDVTDSLLTIKKLIYDSQKVTWSDLKRAIDTNFEDDTKLHSLIQNKVQFFGSGDEEAIALATLIMEKVQNFFRKLPHYRDGHYTCGFWSMSQHVAYGTLSGALPSGKKVGKAFTPGLTPSPVASQHFLDNIKDVARMNAELMDNNIAFNVKITPVQTKSWEEQVTTMQAYVKAYFELGGMQMQFNVVTSEMLKDAMAHPENYPYLMVRISGYNAYFVTLSPDMQQELIKRAEYSI